MGFVAREIYVYGKRALCTPAKETHVHGKRDPRTWQKRPTYMAKETYVHYKRALRTLQKSPMHTGIPV